MSNYLPVEVIEEILVRQPAKSLMRFRSVCKTWYSLISNSRFATAHLARSKQRPSPYFLFERGGRGDLRFSLHSNPAIDSSDFTEFHPPYEDRYAKLEIISIVHYIPCCHGFGYHAPTNEYKVVRITHPEEGKDTLVAEIYSFNNGEYRLLTFSPSAPFYLRYGNTASVFMNGALHWLVEQQQNLMYNLIMSFNLGGETVFHEVPVPKVLEIEIMGKNIAMLNGLLAVYGGAGPHSNLAKKYDVWVMIE
nr:putative f-box protein [Quercus suber]